MTIAEMNWFKKKDKSKITNIENHELVGIQTGKTFIEPGRWFNIKSSEPYEVIDLDVINATNKFSGQRMVYYKDMDGASYIRTFVEFISKFTPELGWRLPTAAEIIAIGKNKPLDSGTSYADLGKEDKPIQTWVKP